MTFCENYSIFICDFHLVLARYLGWWDAYQMYCSPRVTLPVDGKRGICRLPLTHNHFISHFHKHNCLFCFLKSYSWLYENNHESIFITTVSFQMQTLFPPFKACLWWDKSEHTPAWKEKKKRSFPPICAHFRLNMNWPKSPPVEAFLVSAGPGYLIWTQALGSPEFIQ